MTEVPPKPCPNAPTCLAIYMANAGSRKNMSLGAEATIDDPLGQDPVIQENLALYGKNAAFFEDAQRRLTAQIPELAQRCGDCLATLADIETNL